MEGSEGVTTQERKLANTVEWFYELCQLHNLAWTQVKNAIYLVMITWRLYLHTTALLQRSFAGPFLVVLVDAATSLVFYFYGINPQYLFANSH